jgi:hypothetical protein
LFVENEIKWNLIFGFLHKIRIETFAYVGSWEDAKWHHCPFLKNLTFAHAQ